MTGICGVSSWVIWVGDGGGGVETKSTRFSSNEVVAVFTFFGLPCFAPVSTNRLNCGSTKTLFVVASSIMSTMVANSSSSSSNSDRRSLRFPFPFYWISFFFLEAAISFAIFLKFSFVIAYSGLSDLMSSSIFSSSFSCWWARMILFYAGLATWCSVGVLPVWISCGTVVSWILLVSSTDISFDMKVLIYKWSS